MDKKFCPYCMNPVKEGETCTNCGLTEGVYTPRDHHLPLGTVLNNRYLIGRVLGEGGFGITYIGCDLNLEMKAAIKEYFPIDRVYRVSKASLEVSRYAHAAEKFHSGKVKFLREARTMARLDKQQNIVSVKDFFEENNTAYIVMEYVEGTTLKELVNQRGGRIPAGELLHMLEPLFPALTSVHELGLIHRDISPDNLMLENGKIKLLDFGCAREAATQSETMTIALKQGYAPIEQYQHKGQGPWTDVYALSATIYYCLTGKTPQSAVDRLSEEELVPPRKLGVDLTAGQEAALLQGMNVKARDRFQSVEELYAALYTYVMPTPDKMMPDKQISDEPIPAKSIPAGPVPGKSAFAAAVPTESVSAEPYSGSNQYEQVHNPSVSEQNNTTVILDSVEEMSPPKSDQNEEKSAKIRSIDFFSVLKKHLKQRKNRKLIMTSAGFAAMLAVVIFIVWAAISSKDAEEANAPGTDGIGGTTVSVDDSQSDNEMGSGNPDVPSKQLETVETLFANAVVLEESSMEALQALMEDDTVSAIRFPEGVDAGQMNGTITITKPVLVEENASFFFFDLMSVQGENACLWIEGELGGDCVLQTVDGGRVVADEPNCLTPSVLWLEKEEDVRILNGGEPQCENLIIGGKNTLFQNAVEVRDEASLIRAMDQNQAVIICEDITLNALNTTLYLRTPILIEEGVTVFLQIDDLNLTEIQDNALLWNEGKIQGTLITGNDATVINYGEISASVSMQDNNMLINLGDLEIDDVMGSNPSNRIYNIGNLRLQNKTVQMYFFVGLVNYGSVSINFTDMIHFLSNNEIYNYGDICIEEGTVDFRSYLHNSSDGSILVCDNVVLGNGGVIEINSGQLVCDSEGTLNNREGIIYCQYSHLDDYPESGFVHVANAVAVGPDRACEVTDMYQLDDALQDPNVDKIYLTGTVEWNYEEMLTITKEVEISEGAQLLVKKGNGLILDGGFLMNYGYMKVNHLTVIHGGTLRNAGTIEGYSSYTASDRLIRLGNVYGEKDYKWTDCILNDGTIDFYDPEGWRQWKVELYDNALMIQNGILEGEEVHIWDHAFFSDMNDSQWIDEGTIEISGKGHYINLVQQEWSNMSISINNGGVLHNNGGLVIESGDLLLEGEGSLDTEMCGIIFGKDLSVRNYGRLYFGMAADSALLQGYLENHGTLIIETGSRLVIDTPSGAENLACLNNQGDVQAWDLDCYIRVENGEFIGNDVIGNAVVYGND